MSTYPDTTTVADHWFQPLAELLPQCREHTRHCPVLPDPSWLRLFLARALHEVRSGRAFLQEVGHRLPDCPELGSFFESLKSSRRANLVGELNTRLAAQLARVRPDPLAQFPALDNFDVYAGDGHWHGAAAHDAAVDGVKYAMGHFFGLNLRTQAMVHLTAADQLHRRKEHDMRALKRLELQTLRQGAPVGRQVIWVWDKAGIDFTQWYRWKQGSGIYVISCAKENMNLEVIGQRPWDRDDPVNQGVLADELVATSMHVAVRRVTYLDPVSGTRFEFLTTELTLAPGLIAHLYRLRWNIEKGFDEFKNKLGARKAWASGAIAKTIQARFLCLVHNLLLWFEQVVLEPAGVTPQAEDRRRARRLEETKRELARRHQTLPRLVESLQQGTQRSVKFIRWLRSHLFSPTPCSQALASLRASYAKL